MDRTKIVLAVLSAALLWSGCGASGPRAIRVGSKNFTEQVVLGEIVAQHLENRLGRGVERRLNLGGTLLAHRALISGEIDLYPEYSGTAAAAILKQPIDLERVRSVYRREFQVEWLQPLGIDNGFAMVVSGADARRLGLTSLSDAAKSGEAWTLGVGYEFEQRADGLAALEKTYGLRWKGRPKSMDLGLLYKALEQGQVNMIAANATDGQLAAMDLKVLADDRRAFPPYEVCIAVRQDTLERVPGLRSALVELSGKFTNARMQALNRNVDAQHQPISEAAAAFLKQAGLQ